MKKLLFILSFFTVFIAKAQTYPNDMAFGYNSTLDRYELYIRNSPGNGVGNRVVVQSWKRSEVVIDSDLSTIRNFTTTNLPEGVNQYWTNTRGDSRYYTKLDSDSRYLQSFSESDPFWTTEKINYYTKSQSDIRYLQNYTESDPVYSSGILNYYNKTQSDSRYLQSYTETDPIWSSASSSYRTKAQNDALYKVIGYVPTWSEITGKPSFFDGAYSSLTGKPDLSIYYLASNPNGYISSVPAQSWSSITSKPTTLSGYGITDAVSSSTYSSGLATKEPTITTGTTAQYYRGDKTWVNFPTIPNVSGATGTYNTVTINNGLVTSGSVSSPSAVTITLNSSSQISTTQSARVSYSVTTTIALTALVLSGNGMAYLEISPNNSTWTTISQTGYSDAILVGGSLNKIVVGNLQGEIPAGYYRRIRTSVAGGGTITYTCGQETIY